MPLVPIHPPCDILKSGRIINHFINKETFIDLSPFISKYQQTCYHKVDFFTGSRFVHSLVKVTNNYSLCIQCVYG